MNINIELNEAVVVPPEPVRAPEDWQQLPGDKKPQLWPHDPAARDRIIDYLVKVSRPGAQEVRKDKNGQEIIRNIKPREALRAMRTLGGYGKLELKQQRLDHQGRAAAGRSFCLKDHVTAAIGIAGRRLTAEAQRRGLSCAAELDAATKKAIFAEVDAELKETGAAEADRPAAPAPRRGGVIPVAAQRQIMTRLIDMADPLGQEFQVLRTRERLMAARILATFWRLALEQEQLDRAIAAGGKAFDLDRVLDEVEEAARLRLEERKREDEELRLRAEVARPPEPAAS
jgi:hypothetical protein